MPNQNVTNEGKTKKENPNAGVSGPEGAMNGDAGQATTTETAGETSVKSPTPPLVPEQTGLILGAVTDYLAEHLGPLVDAAVDGKLALMMPALAEKVASLVDPVPPQPKAMEDDGGAAARAEQLKRDKAAAKAIQERAALKVAAAEKFGQLLDALAAGDAGNAESLTEVMASGEGRVILSIDDGKAFCFDWHHHSSLEHLRERDGALTMEERIILPGSLEEPFMVHGVTIAITGAEFYRRCELVQPISIGAGRSAELAPGSLVFRL